MNDKLQIFTYQEHDIRTVEIDGEPWFVLKDVCSTFGEQNYRRVAGRLDDDEKGVSRIKTPGGDQKMTIVNESGVYSALFQMQPQAARGVTPEYIAERQEKLKQFKRWVTHEVLPSVRRTGSYIVPAMSTNEIVLMMAQNAVKMEQDIKELQVQTATLTDQTTALTEKFDGAVRAFHRPNTIGEWKVDTEMAIRELSKSINFRGRIYCELETRSGCNLKSRLARARNRLVKNGMTKAQANKVNKLDIIGMDKNLRNIFDAIIREHQASAVVGISQQEIIDAEFEEVG